MKSFWFFFQHEGHIDQNWRVKLFFIIFLNSRAAIFTCHLKHKKQWLHGQSITSYTIHSKTLKQQHGTADHCLPRTHLLHGGRCGQEALLQELLSSFLILHLDLRHHVTRNIAQTTARLPSVEPIHIFISMHLQGRGQRCTKTENDEILSNRKSSGRTLMICPSLNGSSSSAASGLGDIVAGS